MIRKMVAIGIALFAGFCNATSVTFYEGGKTSLDKKWEWAVGSSSPNNIWIGYSIKRTAENDCRIGSWSSHKNHPTLYEVLNQTKPAFDSHSKIAFIFLVDHSKGSSKIVDLKIGSFDSEFNLRDYPLFWLNEIEQDESVSWLQKQYNKLDTNVKKDFVAAFGTHHNKASTDILINMVKYEESKIQKDAVFWLGQPGHDSAFTFLVKTLDTHPEMSVRKAAVFSISQVESENAVDVLIKTARSSSVDKIRKEAIFWLGQMAAKESTNALNDIIYDEPELELKKHAVFSLSQIEDEQAVDDLIKIAKTHPNADVRKSAIFWLGETGSDKALDVLVGMLKN